MWCLRATATVTCYKHTTTNLCVISGKCRCSWFSGFRRSPSKNTHLLQFSVVLIDIQGQTYACVCVFRVTQVMQEVLVFQVWMDVMEPREREEVLAFPEKMDLMENRSEKLIDDQCISQNTLKRYTCLSPPVKKPTLSVVLVTLVLLVQCSTSVRSPEPQVHTSAVRIHARCRVLTEPVEQLLL